MDGPTHLAAIIGAHLRAWEPQPPHVELAIFRVRVTRRQLRWRWIGSAASISAPRSGADHGEAGVDRPYVRLVSASTTSASTKGKIEARS